MPGTRITRPLMLLNAVYGGTTTSKLFLNVRERLSLCYYASSGLMKYKDVMLVSSGVEFSKVGQAQDEILAQLQACKDGGFTDDELEWARRSVVSTLMTTLDAQSRLEDYWAGSGGPPASPRRPTSWPSGWSAPPGRRYRRRPRS